MNRWTVCDICSDTCPQHKIVFRRKRNGDVRVLDICNHCLDDVDTYIEENRPTT